MGSRRRHHAAMYRQTLTPASVCALPERDPGHVYHQFVVRTKRRDALQRHLAARGIETLVHYPVPIPNKKALQPYAPQDCPAATEACREVLSLPLNPSITTAEIAEVASAICEFRED